jgi:hypothetical protein
MVLFQNPVKSLELCRFQKANVFAMQIPKPPSLGTQLRCALRKVAVAVVAILSDDKCQQVDQHKAADPHPLRRHTTP